MQASGNLFGWKKICSYEIHAPIVESRKKAEFMYNHVQNSAMLIYLPEALGSKFLA